MLWWLTVQESKVLCTELVTFLKFEDTVKSIKIESEQVMVYGSALFLSLCTASSDHEKNI